MPLYEIVLMYPDREETRLTDRRPSLGDVLEIKGTSWEVVHERHPVDVQATSRFMCRHAAVQRGRAAKTRAENAGQRNRINELQTRQRQLEDRLDGNQPAASTPDRAS